MPPAPGRHAPNVLFIIPHLPWVCDERFSVPFRDQGSRRNRPPATAPSPSSTRPWRLLAGPKQAGQDRRTIVVFVSDNGMTESFTLCRAARRAFRSGCRSRRNRRRNADVSATFPTPPGSCPGMPLSLGRDHCRGPRTSGCRPFRRRPGTAGPAPARALCRHRRASPHRPGACRADPRKDLPRR